MNTSTYKTIQALMLSTGLLVGSLAWAGGCPGTTDMTSEEAPGVTENETAGADTRLDAELYSYLHDAKVHSPDWVAQDYGRVSAQAGRN
jgi:hypothetical protein